MNIPVYTTSGEKITEIGLPEKFSSIKISVPLLHEVVSGYLSNQRRGTASTKTRAEVSGGGAKPWRQKHTGRARAGSIRSPLWRKGGIVFGPKPRSYTQYISKRKKRTALKMAIKSKAQDNQLIIIKELNLTNHKTKQIQTMLNKLKVDKESVLLVPKQIDKNLYLAARNIENINLLPLNSINAYEVIKAAKVIFTEEAFNAL